MTTNKTDTDPEIVAIGEVYTALRGLEPEAQARVLAYVTRKLKVSVQVDEEEIAPGGKLRPPAAENPVSGLGVHVDSEPEDELEGISPTAKKWMIRNGLNSGQLSGIFSLGVDEIDLVAKSVPGSSKRERMRSVFLLKGLAAYIGTGAARFTHEQMKEACLHYDAFDAANFAANFKTLTSEVTGDKNAGYSLTTRGLTNATEIVKGMLQSGSGH